MEAVRRSRNLKKNQSDDPDRDPANAVSHVSPSDPGPVWAKSRSGRSARVVGGGGLVGGGGPNFAKSIT